MKLYDLKGMVFARNARFKLEIGEFWLDTGEKVALVGPNGSGKTSLLRVLAFLEKPDSWSRFLIRGRPYTGRGDRTGMGFLQQSPCLFHGTVARNLAYPLELRRLPSREVRERIEAMLAMTGLEDLAQRRPRDLSGGEQKRLALGRVLIAEPELLLLDEPTAHLDLSSRSLIEKILKTTEKTILLTTHDLPFALRVADRVLNVREGRIHPTHPENVLEVRKDGSLVDGNGLVVDLPAYSTPPNRNGSLFVSVDPRSLVLAVKPPSGLPLRNRFCGRVSSVREQGDEVWLKVDCGLRLTAIITRVEYERLGINLHRNVVVSFDAKAVEVL